VVIRLDHLAAGAADQLVVQVDGLDAHPGVDEHAPGAIPVERVEPELLRLAEAAEHAGEQDAVVGAVRLGAEQAEMEHLRGARQDLLDDASPGHAGAHDDHGGARRLDHAEETPGENVRGERRACRDAVGRQAGTTLRERESADQLCKSDARRPTGSLRRKQLPTQSKLRSATVDSSCANNGEDCVQGVQLCWKSGQKTRDCLVRQSRFPGRSGQGCACPFTDPLKS
jgi:hypothetical protein